ncbi:hypothetical protein AWH56_021055 [Anaerobacillus isosaccharinicus]|uniref:Uncharacterized protein n=1 Tax=Anaerobacillus isosaccharinicus TaxID=1532552 RepID=A0A1S2LIJ7_9BACI|nr:hypothetical protein [Anaerobacillus isosaccharinicus]MBA5586601.1 hypothetical protein [Anaerobacillus isosaccharinicus]QOY35163.1 hypothetical protein AWH56_021055 [Anaerobacillus isosaccharinicus]
MSIKYWKKLFLLCLVFLFIFPPVHSFAKNDDKGKGRTDTINNINVKDVGDNGDGRDLEVHFNVARDKSKFDHYRIFVVKSSKEGEFDLETANKNANYMVAPKGKNIKTTLESNSKDTDGSLIKNDISYTVFVLSVKEKSKTKGNVLSKAKKDITLSSELESVGAVQDVKVADVSNYGNGRDLQVNFSKLADEKNLAEYRAFVVKSEKAKAFELSNAKDNNHYTAIAKTGANLTRTLVATAKDSDGHAIKNDVNYQVFVMSVGNQGFGSAISSPSAQIMLTNGVTDLKVTNLLVKDVADFGDGRDLQVEFTVPKLETNVIQYRVMVVPTREASTFNLNKALQISSSNYTVVNKAGANIATTLASTAKDVNGAKVDINKSYQVFVLTVGSLSHALSSPSSAITLLDNMTTSVVTNVSVNDIGNQNNGRDMQITFTKVADETTVSEYRIFVVRQSQANSFDLTKANAVATGNYTTVAKTGANITQRLASNAKDSNGRLIENDVAYRVFVMSVSSVGNDDKNALSGASSQIILE